MTGQPGERGPRLDRPIRHDAWQQLVKSAAARSARADQEAREARFARDEYIRAAASTGQFSIRELGRLTGLSSQTVWRIIRHHR